ncbi:hypothetical protein [Bosea sp. (in: a-proteobacteria)]|uniref:hypothetical protein n=1 Tax=Bosea sp. (in: a-proteobacteria) TaxID=1871050 RepID=UPI0025C03315|nr:hypothetical protein [Bosea sp. (in: a-proteobacteria)]
MQSNDIATTGKSDLKARVFPLENDRGDAIDRKVDHIAELQLGACAQADASRYGSQSLGKFVSLHTPPGFAIHRAPPLGWHHHDALVETDINMRYGNAEKGRLISPGQTSGTGAIRCSRRNLEKIFLPPRRPNSEAKPLISVRIAADSLSEGRFYLTGAKIFV